VDLDAEEESAPRPRLVLPAAGLLSWPDFLAVYAAELRAGKYWGVAWDLHACGCPLPPPPDPAARFVARFDRAFVGVARGPAVASAGEVATGAAALAGEGAGAGGAATAGGGFGRVVAVRDTLARGTAAGGEDGPLPLLPSAHHPSDHLPIAVAVDLAA
jgi:hypothetical protein